MVLCLPTEEKPPLRRPSVTALQAATLVARGGGAHRGAESLCGEIPPQILRDQPAHLNRPRSAHPVSKTTRGRRSDQGLEESTQPGSLSRRVHPLLEGQGFPQGRRTNPSYCFMSCRLFDGGTRASWTRMHLAAAQAASHPPGFTGSLARIGAGTSRCVAPAPAEPLEELPCHLAEWPACHEAEHDLMRIVPQEPITRHGVRIRGAG